MTEPTLTVKQVKALFGKTPELAVVGERMYKREGDHYRLLDDRPYASTQEMTDGR